MTRTPSPRLRFRPSLEPLEDRTVPTTFFVDTGGLDTNDGLTPGTPFMTIQRALDVAAMPTNPDPDTINVAPGTYTEQLTISSDVTLLGAGAATTTIQAPAPPLALDAFGNGVIVEMNNAATVVMSGFTVTGNVAMPSENFRSLDYGILVIGGATLTLTDARVTAIRSPLGGQVPGQPDTEQTGHGIGVGISSSQVGHATISGVTVDDYQKTGIRVVGAGTTAIITDNTLTGQLLVNGIPTQITTIVVNGISISGGAVATVSGNTVSDHQFDGAGGGPDLFTQFAAFGIANLGGGAGTIIEGNTVLDNDYGIYNFTSSTSGSDFITGNMVLNNRFNGIILDEGTATASNNTISGSINGLVVISYNANSKNTVSTVTGNTIFNNSEKGVWVLDQSDTGFFPVATVSQNVIHNNGTGVVVGGGPAGLAQTQNDQTTISQNSIFANTPGLGIDLADDGVTLNDTGDADTGPNKLTNYPVLTLAAVVGPNLVVAGFARPGAVIELFIADPDPTGFGEGKTYLVTLIEGSAADLNNTTGSYGPGPVNGLIQGSDTTNRFRFVVPLASLPASVGAGTLLTSTATVGDPATSEFSGNVGVIVVPVLVPVPPDPLPPSPPLPPLPPLPPSKQFLLSSTPSVDPAALSPRFAVTTGGAPAFLAVAPGPGYPAMVRVFDYTSGVERFRFFPYGPAFTGGVNVATGDVTGDGIPDVITGVRSGAGPHVKVFDGVSGAEIASFFAYGTGFLGGVSVAAGDVDGDGRADIITGAGAGAGPHVRVFSGADLRELLSFMAYAPTFSGGVQVAAGDTNGDGLADIVTVPLNGPSHVRVFAGPTGAELASFLAYQGFGGGASVAAGDVNGDGRADIITGANPGAGSHVKVFSGLDGSELRSFLAFDPSFTGGVEVGALDANGDGQADLTLTPQQGPPHVRLVDGLTLAELDSFFAYFPAFTGGVLN